MDNMVKHIYLSMCKYKCCNLCVYKLLFDRVNIEYGKAEDRQMSTGLHRVRDVYCIYCSTLLGWTYVKECIQKN